MPIRGSESPSWASATSWPFGLLGLSASRPRRLAGLLGIAAFHVGLLAMGLWLWALPVLAILAATMLRMLRSPTAAA